MATKMTFVMFRALTVQLGFAAAIVFMHHPLYSQSTTTDLPPATASPTLASTSPSSAEVDPWQWLEDVEGKRALDWVRECNRTSQARLESHPSFAQLKQDLLAILDSDDRIPMVSKHGEYYYNFWRDKENPRGLWRRTTLEEFRKPQPKWEVLLDLDQLAAAEQENWVWGEAQLLRPNYDRALISLSRGGADARVTREFDLPTRSFVKDGFSLPEAKSEVSWIDRDEIFVGTDFGPGSLTESGYPRIVKRWRRGTPLDQAREVYAGKMTDMAAGAYHDDSPGFERDFCMRLVAFYESELFLLQDDGTLKKIDVPDSANKTVSREWLAVELREPWTWGGKTYPAGSLLVGRFDDYLAGKGKLNAVFQPTDTTALVGFGFTHDYLYLNVLDDVKSRISVIDLRSADWQPKALVGMPAFGNVTLMAVDPDESNEYFLTATDFLTPTTLSLGEIGREPERLKSLPAFFDASNLRITQHFTQSDDGTRIPYFMVAREDLPLNGNNPTLLYGYGGFEVPMLPAYSAGVGRAWTTQGGVYVVANIRGGGEYGPRWHQAALKANRLRAYEDFAAVARDLIRRQVTSPRRLGIQGGSNGGLLVGNMVTLYPELFHAAVCQVPLLDMRRYHRLLAGASWMAEYGNPDSPEEWEYIRQFSPYHNVKSNTKYPAVLFTTSTRDDRVHPGHARKMMALMQSQGHEVLYYENIEGGHGGAANNEQLAYMQALAYTFLREKLFP